MWTPLVQSKEPYPYLVNGCLYTVRMISGISEYEGIIKDRYDTFICRWNSEYKIFVTIDDGWVYDFIDMDDVWADPKLEGGLHKINLHAHSRFSDGINLPSEMAKMAKHRGHSALVLTEHYYCGMHIERSLSVGDIERYEIEINKASDILPVITGIEIPFMDEEILIFGKSAIKEIMYMGGISTVDQLLKIREEHKCAIILCHPNNYYHEFIECLDGYERVNSADDYFEQRPEDLEFFKGLQAWYNSDAHSADELIQSYNITPVEIKTEDDLIDYIKSGKSHSFYKASGYKFSEDTDA